MPLFNAVLLPSVGFRDRVVEFAQGKYADIADGYCLSTSVYPHITLAQFKAEDQPMLFIDGLFEPTFTTFNLRAGEGQHDGFTWVEWQVEKEGWITDLQSSVATALQEEGAEILSPLGDEYHPHMTFCRVPKAQENEIDPPLIEQSERPWIFTIGSMDENGQFLG